MDYDPDQLLALLRSSLAAARREAPQSPAVKRAADTFDKLDAALQQRDAIFPEDWCPPDGDDGEDDPADEEPAENEGDEDEEGDDDEAAAEEMRRLAGG